MLYLCLGVSGHFVLSRAAAIEMEADVLFELLASAFFKVHAWSMFELFLVMKIAACLYAAFASRLD